MKTSTKLIIVSFATGVVIPLALAAPHIAQAVFGNGGLMALIAKMGNVDVPEWQLVVAQACFAVAVVTFILTIAVQHFGD